MPYRIREAITDDTLTVRRLLDAAMLEPGDVETRVAAGDVLVGRRRRESVGSSSPSSAAILGVAVLEPIESQGAHLGAIAVRRRHRNRGLGTALVTAALEREGRLTATFDERVRPFYQRLGFVIETIDEQRFRGVCTDTTVVS